MSDMRTQGSAAAGRVDIVGLGIDRVTEDEVTEQVSQGWLAGTGGWIVTPNVDIWLRARRDPSCRELIDQADLVVADGMPLIWASRLAGRSLPERVTGSALVERLAQAAGRQGRSIFVLGGGVGETAARAAAALSERYPGLRLAGVAVPPFGFENRPAELAALLTQVRESGADLVLIGLGFPKQERLAALLRKEVPAAWLLGCGGGVALAAGESLRPPAWAQRIGAEWLVRLAQEPRRLARRYLIDDAPAAVVLLAGSIRTRIKSLRAT